MQVPLQIPRHSKGLIVLHIAHTIVVSKLSDISFCWKRHIGYMKQKLYKTADKVLSVQEYWKYSEAFASSKTVLFSVQ